MKLSPVRILLVLLFVFIGCFGVAYAAAGMLTALPAPAIGGTCGPSTGSETALEALAEPGSIGAGPEPSASNTTGHHQWETFVQQCQALADRRGLASLAVLVVSFAVAVIGLIWVLRKPKETVTTAQVERDDQAGTPAYTPSACTIRPRWWGPVPWWARRRLRSPPGRRTGTGVIVVVATAKLGSPFRKNRLKVFRSGERRLICG